MVQRGLSVFFEKFLKKKSLFIDKKVLQASYLPENIYHREKEINKIANILAPTLKLEKPSNLFIYGKTGTGKTLVIKYIMNELNSITKKKNTPLDIFYLNCKLKRVADTEYRLVAQLAREFGKSIPPTGLPTDEVYKMFFDVIDKKERLVVVILDEIDQLIKKTGDGILYNLTRINADLTKSQISIIGISNNLTFTNNLDPRVKSSLSEEEIIFPPYNALQIQDILKQRIKIAFKPTVIGEGVVEKCSAYAAREHGDARRALELLRVAAEIAERTNNNYVKIKHVDEAEEKIEKDRVLDAITTQPKQFQIIIYSIVMIWFKKKVIFTGEIYDFYKNICLKTGLRPLTQRRVSDVIVELDMLGIINAKVISKGRYGRTKEVTLPIPTTTNSEIKRILEEELNL